MEPLPGVEPEDLGFAVLDPRRRVRRGKKQKTKPRNFINHIKVL